MWRCGGVAVCCCVWGSAASWSLRCLPAPLIPHHQNYKPQYYYFEVVEKVRLVLVSCIGLLILPGSSSQLVFILAVNLIVGAIKVKPFTNGDDSLSYTLMQWCVVAGEGGWGVGTRLEFGVAADVMDSYGRRRCVGVWVPPPLVSHVSFHCPPPPLDSCVPRPLAARRAIVFQSIVCLLIRSSVSEADGYSPLLIAVLLALSQVGTFSVHWATPAQPTLLTLPPPRPCCSRTPSPPRCTLPHAHHAVSLHVGPAADGAGTGGFQLLARHS